MIIFLLGSGGSGKTTIAKNLIKYGYRLPTIITTRQPRNDDINQEYVSIEIFEQLRERLATEVLINGFKYGLKDNLKGNIVIPMDIFTLQQLENKGFDIISVYLNVSYEELEKRLIKRGEARHVIDKKLNNHKKFMQQEMQYADLVVDNTQPVDKVVKQIINYISKRKGGLYDL